MAQVKLGVGITTIKGKIAGNYFQSGRNGCHVKSLPRRIKSQKRTLTTTHKIFSTVKNAWCAKVWTIQERMNWTAYLNRHPTQNRLGELIILTHQLGFMQLNLIRIRNNLPISYEPPREIL